MIEIDAASIVRASRKRNVDSFRFSFTGSEARVTFFGVSGLQPRPAACRE